MFGRGLLVGDQLTVSLLVLEWMTLTARDLLYKSFPNLLCRWHLWATRVLGLTNNYKQPAWGEGIM